MYKNGKLRAVPLGTVDNGSGASGDRENSNVVGSALTEWKINFDGRAVRGFSG